jgi:4-hydroxy-tetrahydrodipicolinate synthase
MPTGSEITGVFNIMATPFTADGAVDVPSLRRLVNFQIGMGAYGLTILGVLGEAAKLTVEERQQVVDVVLETVAGRVPVIVGTSHPDQATCIALSTEAVTKGATGVMIAPPPANVLSESGKPTDAQILAYYQEIAAAYSHPLVVQDFPPINNVVMSADVLAQIAENIPNARYLKLEDPPLMQKIGALWALTDKYRIFGGLGGMFFLEELERGADGTMTGFAFTEILVAVHDAFKAGERARAVAIFDRYLPLIRFENQPVINLSIRKELLRRRGAIDTAVLRKPYAPIDAGTQLEMDSVLRRVGIVDPTRRIQL